MHFRLNASLRLLISSRGSKKEMKNIKSSLAASLLIIGGLIFSLCQNGIITSSVPALATHHY